MLIIALCLFGLFMTNAGSKFSFDIEAAFFEKAGENGPERKVAGILSTEDKDLQGETIIQKGVDYSAFLERGFLNLDHSKDPYHILGYPDEVRHFSKGDQLPDGSTATSNATWMVGTLLTGHKPADQMWELAQSLQKTNGRRRLGLSVEGNILKRSGPDGKIITKAKVTHTALTAKPVNDRTSLMAFVKSLEQDEYEEHAEDAGGKPEKPLALHEQGHTGRVETKTTKALTTSSFSGQALRVQSLEGANTNHEQEEIARRMDKSEAVEWIRSRFPNATSETAGRLVDLTVYLRDRNLI